MWILAELLSVTYLVGSYGLLSPTAGLIMRRLFVIVADASRRWARPPPATVTRRDRQLPWFCIASKPICPKTGALGLTGDVEPGTALLAGTLDRSLVALREADEGFVEVRWVQNFEVHIK